MTIDREKVLSLFEGFDFTNFTDEKVDELVAFLLLKNFNNFNYDFGISKLVIIPEKTDFVIKIPFMGTDIIPCYHNSEAKERKWDYCETEMERFFLVKETPFKDSFAEIILLGFANNYPIYVQEKCRTHSKEDNIFFRQDRLIFIKKYLSETVSFNDCIDWLKNYLDFFGEEQLKNFMFFLEKNEWDDDLYEDNVGYIGERPVIIDYSGFREM